MSFKKIQLISPIDIGCPENGHIYFGRDEIGLWEKYSDCTWIYITTGITTGGNDGTAGSSGKDGLDGTFFGSHGTSGSSGKSGTSGSSGKTGTSGTSGATGTAGSSGSSGNGSAGTSGSSGKTGTSGSSGVDGNFYGSSGTSGFSGGYGGASRRWTYRYNSLVDFGEFSSVQTGLTSLDYFSINIYDHDINTGNTFEGDLYFWINSWIVGGLLKIENFNDASIFGMYEITPSTTVINSGPGHLFYFEFSGLTQLGANGILVDGNDYIISFVKYGSGTSGTSGAGGSGTGGTGSSGTAGTSGISGTAGTSGSSGETGDSGSAGTSGSSGASGGSGTAGTSGSSGTAGTSGTSGSGGTSGLLPILGTSGELVFTDPNAEYGYNVNSGLTFSGNTLLLSGITLQYANGNEGLDKMIVGDQFGNLDWVDIYTGVTDVIDRTFDLKITNQVLSVMPYATKKLIDPGFAYFFLTGNTTGLTPTYLNPLTLDGVLNSAGQNIYTTENVATLGPEMNVNPDGWTATGDAVSVGSGKYTFNTSGVAGSISYNFGTFSLSDVYVFIFYFSNAVGGGFPGITFAGATKTYVGGSYSGSQFNHYEINPINTSGVCTLTVDGGAYTNYYINQISIKKVLSPSNKFISHYTTGITSNEFRSSYTNENISIGLDSSRYLVPTVSTIATGTGNLSFGKQSLYKATVATDNLAIGNYSMWDLREGEDNLAIGNYSLYTNKLGIRNIAIGTRALNLNTANYNIAIGYRVMALATSASSNVGIGVGSFGALTTGGNNTGVGTNSLLAITSGNYNAAFGYGALQAVSTGSQNSSFGPQSFQQVSTGINNVGVGLGVGFSISTGNNNTHIGAYSGGGVIDSAYEVMQYGYNSADGNNTFLGYLASKSTLTSAQTSHSIAIGSDAKVYQNYQVTLGSNNISSTYLKGVVEIRDFTVLANETLSDVVPTGTTKWSTTGDVSIIPGSGITYIFSGGTGSFTQTFANQLNPVKGNRWYKVTFSTTGSLAIPGPYNSSFSLSITGSTFASTTLNFYTPTNTSQFLYLKSIGAPTDISFNMTCSLGTGNGILRFTNLSVKECLGGDLFVNRKITGYGPNVRFQLDPTITGNTSAYFFDTENILTTTGTTLLSIRNSGSTKFDVDAIGNLQILKGNAIYHRQSMGFDTVGDWRERIDDNYYLEYCTNINPTVWNSVSGSTGGGTSGSSGVDGNFYGSSGTSGTNGSSGSGSSGTSGSGTNGSSGTSGGGSSGTSGSGTNGSSGTSGRGSSGTSGNGSSGTSGTNGSSGEVYELLTLAAGENITIIESGSTITISAIGSSGVGSSGTSGISGTSGTSGTSGSSGTSSSSGTSGLSGSSGNSLLLIASSGITYNSTSGILTTNIDNNTIKYSGSTMYIETSELWSSVPSSSTSGGEAGNMSYDSSYLYVCISTNSWLKFSGITF